MPGEIFNSAYQKLKRAKNKLDKIKSYSNIIPGDYYRIHIEEINEFYKIRDNKSYCIVYEPLLSISEEIGEMVSDFVVNLRSSLDHFAYRAVSYYTGKAPDNFVFPVASDRGDMLCHSALSKLEEVIPGSKDLIRNVIRPKDDLYDKYWIFSQMANEDKHRECIPVISVVGISPISCRNEETKQIFMRDIGFSFDVNKKFFLIRAPFKLSFHGDPKVHVRSTFGSESLLAGADVSESLMGMFRVVETTLNHFEAKLQNRTS